MNCIFIIAFPIHHYLVSFRWSNVFFPRRSILLMPIFLEKTCFQVSNTQVCSKRIPFFFGETTIRTRWSHEFLRKTALGTDQGLIESCATFVLRWRVHFMISSWLFPFVESGCGWRTVTRSRNGDVDMVVT